MPTPGEHKTVQARILEYAEAIGWTFVSREEAEQRRGFDPEVPPADHAKNRSLYFDDLLTPSCGNSTRAMPRPRELCSGISAICTPTSTAIGAG